MCRMYTTTGICRRKSRNTFLGSFFGMIAGDGIKVDGVNMNG